MKPWGELSQGIWDLVAQNAKSQRWAQGKEMTAQAVQDKNMTKNTTTDQASWVRADGGDGSMVVDFYFSMYNHLPPGYSPLPLQICIFIYLQYWLFSVEPTAQYVSCIWTHKESQTWLSGLDDLAWTELLRFESEMSPTGISEHLFPCWWHCLGRF